MAARPNNPEDKARQLQRGLYMAAKRSPGRRFHALYDRICRGDVLAEAWRRVKANGGAAGVDAESLSAIERQGVAPFLEQVAQRLRDGRYRPQPVRRRYIPKGDGTQRPLGIPTVRDRVVQAAAKLVLEPIFEADFRDSSFGFRPRRGATGALETIRLHGGRGHRVVVDGDIRQFFDRLDRSRLMELLKRRISDRRVLKLVRQWLEAGVMEDGRVRETLAGTPQGGVISPLLANIYLHVLDETWEREYRHLGRLVRYADDFVVLCRSRAQAEEALRRVREILAGMGLELHPEKTRVVELGLGRQGFVFLGCHLRVMRSHFKGRTYLFRWPSAKAMQRVRGRIRELTDRRRRAGMKDIREVIRDLNPVLRGWGNYFRTGNASLKFQQVDRYVNERLVRLMHRGRRDRTRPFVNREWPAARFVNEFGLHRLVGTIRYPGSAHAA
jgi:group II intron reverse transcriptase/maturase